MKKGSQSRGLRAQEQSARVRYSRERVNGALERKAKILLVEDSRIMEGRVDLEEKREGICCERTNVVIGYLTFDPAVRVSESHKEDEEFDGGKFDT